LNALRISERRLVLLLSAVQFVNVLDFMMVLPLGPDFRAGLGISMSHLGWVSASYAASASVAGVLGTAVLDRFDRRKALGVAMLGLAMGTAFGGMATRLEWLLAARVLAGAFGGPATSLCYAIVADQVPPTRRGRALGTVMGAFSFAAVLGVPVALELARLGSWRVAFFAVAGACLAVTVSAIVLLPPLCAHLVRKPPPAPARPLGEFMRDGAVLTTLGTTAMAVGAGFAIIPNVSAYFQHNLGYPREHLGLLYMVGGAIAFCGMRVGGRLVDSRGAPLIATLGTIVMGADLICGFMNTPPLVPPIVVFGGFMLGNALRAIAASSLSSRVPMPNERARFMSAQAAVQHAASATGAFASSLLLDELPSGALVGMSRVATGSLVVTFTIPFLVSALARGVRAREAERAPWAPLGSG
jgi:predicted MFS family arabinose efflux permease